LDDFLWVAIAVIFGLFSVMSKAAAKKQQEQRGRRQQEMPKWPGPVAGPRPGQGPTWAPAPGPRPMPTLVPKQQQQAAEPKQEVKPPAPKTLVSGDVFTRGLDQEGYGSEGFGTEGQSVEGPTVGEGVEDEVYRFSRETAQMEGRHLSELTDDLVQPQAGLYGVAEERPPVDVQPALADAAGLSRSIVLAEVLGKPKALRGRGVRRF